MILNYLCGAKMEINVFKAKGIYNKRTHDRLDFIEIVQYKLLKQPFQSVFSQNISAMGMCLLLDEEVIPGTILELYFDIPGRESKTISTYSKVVWQRDYLTGVEFIGQNKNH
ncbi:MAG: PilZ domain-containing protein [Candidatus Aminicenantaceae bacterium]